LLIDNAMSKPFTMQPLALSDATPGLAEHLIQQSRQQYGVPRETVEKEILERSQLGASAPPPMVAERKA
jgi:hypothetical protein